MARPCKWCGKFFQDVEELANHEDFHRDIEKSGCLDQNAADCNHYSIQEDSQKFHKIGRPCKWGGVFIKDSRELSNHEQAHRDLDFLNSNINTGEHRCSICQKLFAQKKNLMDHIQAKHEGRTYTCYKCQKVFRYRSNMVRHEKTCSTRRARHVLDEYFCHQCGKRCSTAHGLRRHIQGHDKMPKFNNQRRQRPDKRSKSLPVRTAAFGSESRPCQFRCRRCTQVFNNRHDLYLHGIQYHYSNQHGGALQPRPWERDDDAPWGGDEALQRVYEAEAPIILEHHLQGPSGSVYIFPLTNEVNLNLLMRFAEDIYQRQQRAFRLNLVFGVILQNRETGRYRYFVPYTNSGIFERPLLISKHTDQQGLRHELARKDIFTELLRQRPDTKWIPVLVTNVHFLVTETYYPLGQGQLPDYLLKKDSLYPLVKSRKTRKLYKDNLGAFRCLTLHNGYDIMSLEGPAKQLFRQWTDEAEKDFAGLSFEDFPEFETIFGINLEVYSLSEDGFAHSIYKSRHQQETTMYVNLYGNHLSYIRNFAQYAEKYHCKTCDRHFNHAGNLHKHQNICKNKTKFVYPGGFHQATESIFDQMDQYDIHVPDDERTFPWYICFDFEVLLQKIQDHTTDMLQWTHKHIPISVSICSNVEGHTDPVCIVEADQDQLVGKMVTEMNDIAFRVYELAEEKWGWVLESINEKVENEWLDQDLEMEGDSEDEIEDDREIKKPSHPLQKIYGRMETYIESIYKSLFAFF